MPLEGFGGGGDREWLEPLTESGSRRQEHPDYGDVVGCHTGRHEFLNIYGAQPGYTYKWERRNTSDIRSALMRGGEIVRDDDPEMAAGRAAAGHVDLGVSSDSGVEYRELQLFRYSDTAMRKIREEESRKREAMLTGGAEDFVNSRQGGEMSEEHNPRGVATRFATSDHRTEFRGSTSRRGDVLNDQWTPDRGIIE